MEPASIGSIDRLRWLAVAAVMAAGIYLAVALPITGTEAYAFGHFVRPPVRDWVGVFDLANRVLNTLLMKRTVGLFRLSAFSLRIPEILGLALYLWVIGRLTRGRWWAIALAGAGYLALQYCTPGTALDLALSFWVCAAERAVARKLNLAGLCLGLSVAANFCFLIPSAVLALATFWFVSRETIWLERVVVTGCVAAFVPLILPFSHASAGELAALTAPPPIRFTRTPEDLSGLIAVLRREARGKTVRIAASAELIPVVEFYQARYREAGWRPVRFPNEAKQEQAAYYVIDTSQSLVPGRVLYRGRTVALVEAVAP